MWTEDTEHSCWNAIRSGDKQLCTLTTSTVGKGQVEVWRRPWPGWHGHRRLFSREWLCLSLEVHEDKEHLLWSSYFLWGKHGHVCDGAEITMGTYRSPWPRGSAEERSKMRQCWLGSRKELLNQTLSRVQRQRLPASQLSMVLRGAVLRR